MTHACPMCGGAAHPSTGCAYTSTFVVCWACTLEFARWLERWTNSKGLRKGKASGVGGFYEHVRGPEARRAESLPEPLPEPLPE